VQLSDFIVVEVVLLVPLIWGLRRVISPWMLSPVWLLLGAYGFIAVLGRYALGFTKGPPGQEFMLQLLPSYQLENTFAWFLLVGIAFSSGAILWALVSQKTGIAVAMQRGQVISNEGFWTVAAALPVLVLIAGAGGIHVILERNVYLTNQGNPLKILGLVMTPFAVILTGYGFLAFRSRQARAGMLLIAAVYFLITFALATRVMAMIPGFFALGAFVARPELKRTKAALIFSGIMSLALLPVPLVLRCLGEQGLIPFTKFLLAGGRILRGPDMLRTVLGSILIAFPLTTFVGYAGHLSGSYLAAELNPLPGVFTNWYEVTDHLKVNAFSPYNTLGELWNHGILIGAVFYLSIGFYLAHVDWKIRTWANEGRTGLSLILFGFYALFVLLSLEYPLRNCVRLLYYSLMFEVALQLMSRPIGVFTNVLVKDTGLGRV
jgi:hypothetical protein